MKKIKTPIVIMGAVPPPYIGPNIATEVIINSRLKEGFNLIHLDTSDHRSLNTLNRLDLWNIFLAIKHYFLLLKLIIRHRPALIYIPICQTTIGYFRDAPFILLAKLFGSKVVCHLRGSNFRNWYLTTTSLTRWIIRRVHSLVDGQIVLGDCLRDLFSGILPPEKIFVVPNGANYFFDIRKRNVNNKNKIRILFLSNLGKEKGAFDVLEAVPKVVKIHNNVEFIFAGDRRNEETINEFIKFIKANPLLPITLTGPLYGKAKTDLLLSGDVFVFPPREPEGHPWAIVEAMAAGLPIITTDQGAIKESVKDGVNGFIVEKRNPHQIAEKIKFLIENPDVRKKMGEESRRLYLENFTEEKMIERLSYAFHAVLSR